VRQKHDLHPLRKKLLEAAVPFYQWFTEQKPGEATLEARGWAQDRLARVRMELGDREAARKDFERMQASFARLTADFPTVPEYRLGLGMSHHRLGILLAWMDGQLPAVEPSLRRGLDIFEKLAADFPTEPKYREELARSPTPVGRLLKDLGQRPQADEAARRALPHRCELA